MLQLASPFKAAVRRALAVNDRLAPPMSISMGEVPQKESALPLSGRLALPPASFLAGRGADRVYGIRPQLVVGGGSQYEPR